MKPQSLAVFKYAFSPDVAIKSNTDEAILEPKSLGPNDNFEGRFELFANDNYVIEGSFGHGSSFLTTP